MKVLPLAKTKRTFGFSLFTFVVALLVFAGFFFVIQKKNSDVLAVSEELREEIQKDEELRILKKTLEETEKEQAMFDARVIQTGEEAAFLEFVEDLASNAGTELKIDRVAAREKLNDPYFEYFEVSLKASGSWDATYRFVRLVSLLPFANVVDDVRLETVVISEEGPLLWESSIRLFVLKDK